MKLTDRDREMLDGVDGEGVALAMQVLGAIGRAFDAEQMCDISRAHVALSNQDADIWFAERLRDLMAKATRWACSSLSRSAGRSTPSRCATSPGRMSL